MAESGPATKEAEKHGNSEAGASKQVAENQKRSLRPPTKTKKDQVKEGATNQNVPSPKRTLSQASLGSTGSNQSKERKTEGKGIGKETGNGGKKRI